MLYIAPGLDAPRLNYHGSRRLAEARSPPGVMPAFAEGPDVRARISEASYAAALDLTSADQPHKVLLHAQLAPPFAVDGLSQLQGRAAKPVLHEVEQNIDLGQFRPAPGPSSRYH